MSGVTSSYVAHILTRVAFELDCLGTLNPDTLTCKIQNLTKLKLTSCGTGSERKYGGRVPSKRLKENSCYSVHGLINQFASSNIP